MINTKQKQPYAFMLRDGELFAFAGLWERWRDNHDVEAPVVQSCTIITTEANGVVRPVHDRMPVILPLSDFAAWLDPMTAAADVHQQLRPYAAEEMEAEPLGRFVGN
jgi:putative SOS response-associated peptidase YedK